MSTQITVGSSTFNLPSSSIINPGSVFQSYNPGTGQTTYPNAPAGYASLGSTLADGTQAQSVETPTNTPIGASVYQTNGTYQGSSPSTNFSNKTINGIPITTSDFSLNPNGKFADVSVKDNISSQIIKEAPNTGDKANEIVNTAQKQTTAKSAVNAQLQDVNVLNKTANTAFIQAAVQGALGRAASADELGTGKNKQYNLTGLTVAQVAQKLGYNVPSQTNGNLPGANSQNPASATAPDPTITDLQTGLIDLQKFQTTFLDEWQKITDKVNQDQTDLANYKSGTAEATQNVGQQVGTEQGLLQGEALAVQQQRALKENTLTTLLGIDQQAKSDLVAKGQLQESMMTAANNLKQQIWENARTLRSDQQTALANFLETSKAMNIDPSKMTTDQTLWVAQMAQATGMPSSLLIDGLKNTYVQNQLANQKTETMTIGNQQYLLTYDNNGKIINKTLIGAKPSTASGGSSSTGITEANKTAITNNLVSQVGSDGYLNPADYNSAKQDWIQAGGSPADFDSEFSDRRNPQNSYYDISGKASTINATDENAITQYKSQGYTAQQIKDAGYDQATVDKAFNTGTSDKKWWEFWK